MPHLLDHPPLLAHSVYQTVAFDDAIRRAGYDHKAIYSAVRRPANRSNEDDDEEWPGLVNQLLSTDDWFERWLRAEKACEQQSTQMRFISSTYLCEYFRSHRRTIRLDCELSGRLDYCRRRLGSTRG